MDDEAPLPSSQMPEALVTLALDVDDVFLGAASDDLIVAVASSNNTVRIGPWGGTASSGSQAPLVVGFGTLVNGQLSVSPGANMVGDTDASLVALYGINFDQGGSAGIAICLSNASVGAALWLAGDGAPRPSLLSLSNAPGADLSVQGDALVVTSDRLIGVNWPSPAFQLDVQGAINAWSNSVGGGPFVALTATNLGGTGAAAGDVWEPGDVSIALSNTGTADNADGCAATLSLSPDSVAALSNPVERDDAKGVPTPRVCLATPTLVATFGDDDALLKLTPTVYADQVALLLCGGDLDVQSGNVLMAELPFLTSNGLLSNVAVGSFCNCVVAKRGYYFEGTPLVHVVSGVGTGVGLGVAAPAGSTTGAWNVSTLGWDLVFQNDSNVVGDAPGTLEVDVVGDATSAAYATLLTLGPDARINGPRCNVTTRCNLTVDCNLLVRGRAAISNAATMSSNLGIQCLLNVYGVASFSNAAFCSSNVSVATALSIGPTANDASFPLWVQTVNAANISIYAAGDIASFSDARYKSRVRRIEGALAKVCAIGGYTFERSNRSTTGGCDRRMAGVLAHEVAAVLPEVVSEDSGGMLHVSYGNLAAALLIEATKELAARTATFRFATTTPDEPFDIALPAAFGDRGGVAVVGAEDAYGGRCFARVDGGRVVGRCETPGRYAVIVSGQ